MYKSKNIIYKFSREEFEKMIRSYFDFGQDKHKIQIVLADGNTIDMDDSEFPIQIVTNKYDFIEIE